MLLAGMHVCQKGTNRRQLTSFNIALGSSLKQADDSMKTPGILQFEMQGDFSDLSGTLVPPFC